MRLKIALALLLVAAGDQAYAQVTAIAADKHPNLFFNQLEIEALRRAVLVEQSPQYAVNVYNSIKTTSPAHKPSNLNSLPWPENYTAGRYATLANMSASFSYMIEPTAAKASALRSALLSWTSDPNRGWSHDVQSAGHAHFALAWMYDLIYNAGVLSQSEKAGIDDFFSDISRLVAFGNSEWTKVDKHSVDAEGSYRESYGNWWHFDFAAGVVFALVSHDQSAVDRIFITRVPENYFLQDISQYAPDTRDLKNMINGLVYPSGYNFDGYVRSYSFEGESYHFYALLPLVLGAEAAAHNGFDAWSYQDTALLRTFKKGAPWAGAAHRGDNIENYLPSFWIAYRRFPNDPVIQAAIQDSRASSSFPWIFDRTLPLWGAMGVIMPPGQASPAPPTNLRIVSSN
jgi:hypothetical protein